MLNCLTLQLKIVTFIPFTLALLNTFHVHSVAHKFPAANHIFPKSHFVLTELCCLFCAVSSFIVHWLRECGLKTYFDMPGIFHIHHSIKT